MTCCGFYFEILLEWAPPQTKWTLLRHSRHSKFLTTMHDNRSNCNTRDWPVQRGVRYNSILQAFDLFKYPMTGISNFYDLQRNKCAR